MCGRRSARLLFDELQRAYDIHMERAQMRLAPVKSRSSTACTSVTVTRRALAIFSIDWPRMRAAMAGSSSINGDIAQQRRRARKSLKTRHKSDGSGRRAHRSAGPVAVFEAGHPNELQGAIAEALAVDGPAIVDCVVDPDELPNMPHVDLGLAKNYAIAKISGHRTIGARSPTDRSNNRGTQPSRRG